ncbi:hypothetical protein BDP27DRAFT_1451256 [Rhodocollybia butyracea]|uniref:Uncharacterized protein n=1 Tax=Rhodocollybia butyracea TaxID=206335 RepID=A0A9P5PGI7_9AGAR|nr:hypothetical protein BDP27DRAFT_1451256 [Rhodocollybia butyracea]
MAEAAIYRRTYAIKILLLLVESGAIFCAVQLIYIAVFLTIQGDAWRGWARNMDMKLPVASLTGATQQNIASDMIIFASAFYPIVVAILIRSTPSPEMVVNIVGYTQTGDHDHDKPT